LQEKYTKRTLNLDTKTEEALEYLNGQKEIEERGIGIKKLKNETRSCKIALFCFILFFDMKDSFNC
jgi:hypothetical protein